MSARVEAAAKALLEVESAHAPSFTWEVASDVVRRGYTTSAHAALSAADSVMFSEAAIERAAKASFESVSGLMGFPGPFETAPEPLQETYRDIARAVVAALREEA